DFAKRFDPDGLRMVVEIGLADSGGLLENILDAAAQVIPRSDGCVVRLQQFDAPRVYVRLKPSRIPPWLTQTVQEAHS
ncbi:MAG: hypothetical protein ACPGFC_04165, partial [Paracoccaceae bacterium]